jgi:hypothetical protein
MSPFVVGFAIIAGLIMYRLMVSETRWLSILGYVLGVLFVAVLSMQIGMNLKECAPTVPTWYM